MQAKPKPSKSIEFVSATLKREHEFRSTAPLGVSLSRLQAFDANITSRIFYENSEPLANCYNQRIEQSEADYLVFVHDDVWLDDYHTPTRVSEALGCYDIIGVAGNKQRAKFQPSWAFINTEGGWDSDHNLSAAVAHGWHPFGNLGKTWKSPADCKLLDGVFLAVNRKQLVSNNVRFDPQFRFHFYDLDFCRSATEKGLKLGTWPIAITHVSGGNFDSKWIEVSKLYFKKWGD
ncbi:MAG: glycosyltransferase [Luteolibacter sp.]